MGTHALVCLCCENLGFDKHFSMPFDSEEDAIQFAVERLVECKIIRRDESGRLCDDGIELASNEQALEHYQNQYLGRSEYFHVVEIMQPPVKLFVPPADNAKDPHETLNSDVTSSEARALHRVVRAMHDGNCPKCGHLGPADSFRVTGAGRLRCPHPACDFKISVDEANAALETFHPFMALNVEIFEKWRATRNAAAYQYEVDDMCKKALIDIVQKKPSDTVVIQAVELLNRVFDARQPFVAEPFKYQSGFSIGDRVRLKYEPEKYNRDQGLRRGDSGCVIEPPNPETWPVDAVQISTGMGQGAVEAECLERCDA